MKCTVIIDKEREPEVVVYAPERSETVLKIMAACEDTRELFGYEGESAVRLEVGTVSAFISEGDRVYALVGTRRLAVRERLYVLLERYGGDFLRINQSCLGNVSQIERFTVSFGGMLAVKFKNGYTDYVSRREIKKVKERIGLKL
ncbi:MAG: LytTR family transcriptional regulator [Clostridia bacterium]|nr:LytTR family transcriptional regulator [Clostridia bacterium]